MEINVKIQMTPDDENDYENATHCYICEKEFKERSVFTSEQIRVKQLDIISKADKKIKEGEQIANDGISKVKEGNKTREKVTNKGNTLIRQGMKEKKIAQDILNGLKVRDHDHYNGKYRGAAHSICNLNFNFNNYKIPAFIHNLKGYDEHLIIDAFGMYGKYISKKHKPYRDDKGNTYIKTITKEKEMRIECIPSTTEKYMTIRIGNMQFKDSCGFLAAPLETLADNLFKSKGEVAFPCTKAVFGKMYGDKWKLLLRKGVYPYEWMDSFDKFNETSLPTR